MSDTDDGDEQDQGQPEPEFRAPIEPLKCIRILLESMQQFKDGWQFDERGLDWGFNELIALLRTPEMPLAIEQFISLLEVAEFEMEQPEMAQRLADEFEARVPDTEADYLKELMDSAVANKAAEAQRDFAKLMGPQSVGEPVPEPTVKIEFKRPRNIKG